MKNDLQKKKNDKSVGQKTNLKDTRSMSRNDSKDERKH